jgi:CubicO group peptidase (beta-lactamase class C family)
MEQVRREVASAAGAFPIEGSYDPRFAAVVERFADNFAAGKELGASLGVYFQGRPVIDLWGGFTDPSRTTRWGRETIVNMMSVSKGVSAVCVFMLVERGLLDPEAPVARYWPEFAAAGKAQLALKYVLDHRAGLPYVTETLPRGSAYDARAMADALARSACLFPPGDQPAYHVLSQGYILAEIVRRVTGESMGAFFRREVAEPLGIDYNIGLLPQECARCATFVTPPDAGLRKALDNPTSPDGVYWAQLAEGEDFNSNAFRTAIIPSANGHGNGRAVARLYGALANGGQLDGVRILKPETIERLRAEQHNLQDRIRPRHYHQASGVVRNSPPVAYMGPNPGAFGHQGAGGAIGFGDPEAGIGFAYGMNLYAAGGEAERRAPLVDATFAALD